VRAERPSRVKLVASLLLAVAIFAFLLRRVDVDAVWAEIQEMTWFELVTIALIAGWNLVTYWALWMAVTPGLRWTQAMTVAQSGTAVTNTVPGGSGIGVGLALAMLDSWGFSRARSTLAVLITGVWNTFIKLALPVLALALIALQGDASATRMAAGATAIVLLGVAVGGFWQMLRSDRAAARAGVLAERTANRARRLLKRPPVHGWAEATTRFRNRARDLLQARGGWITAAALVSHLSLYLVLLVTLRHVGVGDAEVGWAQVLFVFAGARLATAIRFTPGGAGVVEAVLIGGLVAFGGDPAQVTASVLVFRALTWLLPVPLGGPTSAGAGGSTDGRRRPPAWCRRRRPSHGPRRHERPAARAPATLRLAAGAGRADAAPGRAGRRERVRGLPASAGGRAVHPPGDRARPGHPGPHRAGPHRPPRPVPACRGGHRQAAGGARPRGGVRL
jgi:uncharacterized membrane protein YbhN (UPF0104 family)